MSETAEDQTAQNDAEVVTFECCGSHGPGHRAICRNRPVDRFGEVPISNIQLMVGDVIRLRRPPQPWRPGVEYAQIKSIDIGRGDINFGIVYCERDGTPLPDTTIELLVEAVGAGAQLVEH